MRTTSKVWIPLVAIAAGGRALAQSPATDPETASAEAVTAERSFDDMEPRVRRIFSQRAQDFIRTPDGTLWDGWATRAEAEALARNTHQVRETVHEPARTEWSVGGGYAVPVTKDAVTREVVRDVVRNTLEAKSWNLSEAQRQGRVPRVSLPPRWFTVSDSDRGAPPESMAPPAPSLPGERVTATAVNYGNDCWLIGPLVGEDGKAVRVFVQHRGDEPPPTNRRMVLWQLPDAEVADDALRQLRTREADAWAQWQRNSKAAREDARERDDRLRSEGASHLERRIQGVTTYQSPEAKAPLRDGLWIILPPLTPEELSEAIDRGEAELSEWTFGPSEAGEWRWSRGVIDPQFGSDSREAPAAPPTTGATHILTLRDGRIMRGELIEETAAEIRFALHGIEAKFARAEVESVVEINP